MPAVSLSPRVTWLIARRLTTTERCTCANCAGSSCATSSFSAVAISASPGLARVAAPRDARVFRVGTQIVDLVDRDEAQGLTDLRADPAQRRVRRAALQLRSELAQQRFGIERGLRRGQTLLQPRDGFGEPRRLDRLDQIIEHAFGERLHGVADRTR